MRLYSSSASLIFTIYLKKTAYYSTGISSLKLIERKQNYDRLKLLYLKKQLILLSRNEHLQLQIHSCILDIAINHTHTNDSSQMHEDQYRYANKLFFYYFPFNCDLTFLYHATSIYFCTCLRIRVSSDVQ